MAAAFLSPAADDVWTEFSASGLVNGDELSRMLGITHDPTHPFAARYLPVLQDSPHAVMGHAAVREALRSLHGLVRAPLAKVRGWQ